MNKYKRDGIVTFNNKPQRHLKELKEIMQNAILKKGLALGIFLCFLLVIPVKGINDDTKKLENIQKTNPYDQIHITSHLATSEEIKKMEQQCGIFNPNKNYNIIYGGHGTGLAPPTESDYNSMIGSLQIVDTISSNQPLLSSCDLSNDSCFPSVGDQEMQGSCAAWAGTYYATGFMIGKNYNWTQAHTGDTTQLLSPAWTYNKCNDGEDDGSWMYDNMHVIQTVGCSRLCTMPYNDSDPVSWGDENAWRDAPPYRVNNVYSINPPFNNSTISSIKTLLSGGQPITFALDASSYNNFGSDDVLGSNAMGYNIDHGNTIVGYDDSKTDVETGETGAFKVVNSWGSTWGPDNNGYYWMTYQAFLGTWNNNPLNFDDALYVNSTLKLLAVWKLNPVCDRSASVELGIGSYDNPLAKRQPWWDGCSLVMHEYPSFMCLDVSEFYSIWINSVDDFYLKIGNAPQDGTITSFKLEYYKHSYSPGNATVISNESLDVPKNTPCHVDVYFRFPNRPPKLPTITGPVNAKIKVATAYNFTTIDPDGDNVSYFIDWGDGTNSSWIGPYSSGATVTQSHTWTTKGIYIIEAKAEDIYGYESDWGTFIVTIEGVPILKIQNVTGGLLKAKTSIKNIGTDPATNIHWTFGSANGTISSLVPGQERKITSGMLIGFGKKVLKITANCTGRSDSKDQDVMLIFIFILIR